MNGQTEPAKTSNTNKDCYEKTQTDHRFQEY